MFERSQVTFNPDAVSLPRGRGKLVCMLETSEGAILIELFEHQAPRTVRNFVGLATGQQAWKDPNSGEVRNDPLYDGTLFHRVDPGFMIQGGDPLGTGFGGPGYTFRDEFSRSLSHNRAGVVSMANSGPNTNGSQFFILDAPAPFLDRVHAIFGAVMEGIEVVHRIANSPCDRDERPLRDIHIHSAQVFRR